MPGLPQPDGFLTVRVVAPVWFMSADFFPRLFSLSKKLTSTST